MAKKQTPKVRADRIRILDTLFMPPHVCGVCGHEVVACLDHWLCGECGWHADNTGWEMVLDHRTDHDGVTEAFPIMVKVA